MSTELLPDGVVVRRASPEDAEAMAHPHVDVWEDAYTGLMPQQVLDERRDTVSDLVERWRTILGSDHLRAGT